MKNRLGYVTILAALLIGLVACSGGSSGQDPSPTCDMRAKVNGADWCGRATFLVAIGLPGTNNASVAGQSTDLSAIVLNFEAATAGTYSLANGEATYVGPDLKTFDSVGGSVIITSVSATEMSGRFSFEAANAQNPSERRAVTDGTFVAKKQ